MEEVWNHCPQSWNRVLPLPRFGFSSSFSSRETFTQSKWANLTWSSWQGSLDEGGWGWSDSVFVPAGCKTSITTNMSFLCTSLIHWMGGWMIYWILADRIASWLLSPGELCLPGATAPEPRPSARSSHGQRLVSKISDFSTVEDHRRPSILYSSFLSKQKKKTSKQYQEVCNNPKPINHSTKPTEPRFV